MYRLAYAQTTVDSSLEGRAKERQAIARSIELMQAAAAAGTNSREAIVALNFLRQLWTILIEDLASPGNALPPMLRAQIISIGLSLLRQADDIRMERHDNFDGLIDVSRLIMEGLA
jgi:flagellar biosynthesis activator protein FlaF